MSYSNSSRTSEPSTAALIRPLDLQQPIDDVVTRLMTDVHRKGRGFVLDLAPQAGEALAELESVKDELFELMHGELNDGQHEAELAAKLKEVSERLLDPLAAATSARRGVQVAVQESLPPHDEFEPKADYRTHVLADAASLVAWMKKYGSTDRSVIFIDERSAVGVLDDTVERGLRESATVSWRPADDWNDWTAVVNKTAMGHRELYRFLMIHEQNLTDPGLLVALSQVRSTATVDHNSDIADSGNTVGVVFKTAAGDAVQKFQKQFGIALPVLDVDTDSGTSKPAMIKVEVVMPSKPLEPITFRLYCSTWQSIWRERIREEESRLRRELEGWLVLNGSTHYQDRPTAD